MRPIDQIPSLPQSRPVLHPALPYEDEADVLRSVERLGKVAADGGQERDVHVPLA